MSFRAATVLTGAVLGAHLLPSVLTVPAVCRRVAPQLSGLSSQSHVALTFDDGPDAVATPAFLDVLAALDVRATFFVLGTQLQAHPDVGRRIVDEGHEIAVHGWVHTPHLLRAPWRVRADIARTRACVLDVCGVTPRFWRPPNGIISGAGLAGASSLALRPVLWTADGRDWAADATGESIAQRVGERLEPGAVVLLHDSDITSARDSWRRALDALPRVVADVRARGWPIGPLREHWTG